MFFTGDFNGHSQLWWQGGDSTPEGNSIEDLTTMPGLTQLINEQNKLSQTNIPLVLISFLLTKLILCSKVEHILLWIHIAIVVSTSKRKNLVS